MKQLILTLVLGVASALPTMANVSMPSFFSDGMVLQQQSKAKVWGWAKPNTQVSASFAGKKSTATTDKSGKWTITFDALKATTQGEELSITVGDETKVIKDVVVGEVWIASGQSNMEWSIQRLGDETADNQAKDDLLRVYVSRNVTSDQPVKDFPGKWLSTKPANTPKFTAVGYYYAKALREKLNVPVGIIECAWGGKRIEPFISDASMKQAKDLQYLVEAKANAIKRYSPEAAQKRQDQVIAKWKQRLAAWEKTKKGRQPRKPQMPPAPAFSSRLHSTIYNGMIAPIAGYSAKGAIWYQGESNANDKSAHDYSELLKLLIRDWQKQWDSKLSFYYVQLANFGQTERLGWVPVQDEMRQLLDDPEMEDTHIGMAVINDIGNLTNIHPSNKIDVGQRLARWALHQDYGFRDIIVSGPLYASSEVSGTTMTIHFNHAKGLKTRDGKAPGAFELLDSQGKWLPAEAKIKGDTVVLHNDQIKKPTQARYAWNILAEGANLVNGEDLPTSCFTTK
ncbi:hypothetical protein JIN77_03455 [Verrucomicrobiaceae bacterium R5-34]|nr:hypothetical protein [Verrucomicrobiaceae bacterium R5-34]